MKALKAASNPWYSSANESQLPLPKQGSEEVITNIAQLLYNWPDTTPLHLHISKTRYMRFMQTIAGYPVILPGILPNDQPLHPLSQQAQELSLGLDAWPPLAGKGSLRSELMWLDRMRCFGCTFGGQTICDDIWLLVVLSWMFAGLEAFSLFEENRHPVIFDLLYDPEDISKAVKETGRLIREFMTCKQLLIRPVTSKEFARATLSGPRESINLIRFAQWLWWCRSGIPIQRGRQSNSPEGPPEQKDIKGILEVRFHHIKQWMIDIASDTTSDGMENNFFGISLRGASFLLEAVISSLRIMLIDFLGVGNLIIDGGHCLQFGYGPDHQPEDVYLTVIRIIDHLLYPESHIDRRFGMIFRLSHISQHFQLFYPGQHNEQVNCQLLTELAWHLIPPLSITLSETTSSKQCYLPFRQIWQNSRLRHDIPNSSKKSSFHRRDKPMTLRKRICTEIGVLASREKVIGLHLSGTIIKEKALGLPKGTDPIVKLLLIDLNGMSTLFESLYARAKSPLKPSETIERISRCSYRCLVLWLNTIRKSLLEISRYSIPEPLILAGDDLVIGARMAETHLLGFAIRLYEGIVEFNKEMPDDYGISFCGVLFEKLHSKTHRSNLLMKAMNCEVVLKEYWREEILMHGSSSIAHPIPKCLTQCRWFRMGYGKRTCILVEILDLSIVSSMRYVLTSGTGKQEVEVEGEGMSLERQQKILGNIFGRKLKQEALVYADSKTVILRCFPM